MDSFLDPSSVGRWERTPITLPILDHLDIIDEPAAKVEGLTQVSPSDLKADPSEYVIGPGDSLVVEVYELLQPGQSSQQGRRVNELGLIRLPEIGTLKVDGKTESQLEKEIAELLEKRQQIKNATVTVQVTEARQRTYSVLNDQQNGSSGTGVYGIPHGDYRLLEALSASHVISGSVKRIYVIRGVQLVTPDETGNGGPGEIQKVSTPPTKAPANPAELIQDLMNEMDNGQRRAPAPPTTAPDAPVAPAALQEGIEPPNDGAHWVNLYGKWVKVEPQGDTKTPAAATQPATAAVQRVIEIPYDKLLDGHMEYNIVIRPGDIIRVPSLVSGNVYLGGKIGRPGTFQLPGEKDLNLKQLIFAAGGLTDLAIPERVDLTRRIGDNQETTIRLNLRAIFDGTQPDFFLKPNDTINIGTNFWATPLAVLRNGFRASYGFGFSYDRNFDQFFNNGNGVNNNNR